VPQSDPHTCRLPFDIWCFSQSVSLHLHSQGVPRTPLSSTELSTLLSLSPAGVVLKLPLCIWFYFPLTVILLCTLSRCRNCDSRLLWFENLGLNLVPEIFPWFSSVPPIPCPVSTLNYVTLSYISLHILTPSFFSYDLVTRRNRNSSANIVTGLRAEWPRNRGSIPCRCKRVISPERPAWLWVAWAPMAVSMRESGRGVMLNTYLHLMPVFVSGAVPSSPPPSHTHTHTPVWRAEERHLKVKDGRY